MKTTGPHPYPHKFNVSISLLDFIEKYQFIDNGEQLPDEECSLAGKK